MKIKSSHLKRIIKEETQKVISEIDVTAGLQQVRKFGKQTGIPEIEDVAAQISRVPFKFFKNVFKKAFFSPIKTAKLISWIVNDRCGANNYEASAEVKSGERKCHEQEIGARVQKWLEAGGVDPEEEWEDIQTPSDAYSDLVNNHTDELIQIIVDYYNEQTDAGLTLESLRAK